MTKTLFCLVFAMFSFCISKGISVNGIISTNTTWTKANSPYIVDGNLLIAKNIKLNIEPGVEVRVSPATLFYVDGSLEAIGTPTDSIRFVKNGGKYLWDGIVCRDSDLTAVTTFQYCRFDSAHITLQATNRIVNINNCAITRAYYGLIITGCWFNINNNIFTDNLSTLNVDYGTGVIADNILTSAQGGNAISVGNVSHALITRNNLHHCNTCIRIYSIHDNDTVEISNNKAVFSDDYGISLDNTGNATTAVSNIVAYGNGGISLNNTRGIVTANTIRHVNSAVSFGWSLNDMQFENNCIDSINKFLVTNTTTKELTLKSNYWGTTDSTQMLKQTYDYFDDFTKGKIHYGAFLQNTNVSCQITPDTIINNPTTIYRPVIATVTVKTYPNPFTSSFFFNMGNIDAATTIEIYNMVGTKIKTVDIVGKTAVEVDMSIYSSGMYIYRVSQQNNTIYMGKLIKN